MQFLADFVNFLSAPQFSFTLSIVLFLLAMRSRRLWTKAGGFGLLAAGVGFFLLSLINPDFRLIVTKEDNVPIVMMVFLVGFFFWLSMHKALKNDQLAEAGEPPSRRPSPRTASSPGPTWSSPSSSAWCC